jgi:hypothetical protein
MSYDRVAFDVVAWKVMTIGYALVETEGSKVRWLPIGLLVAD